LAYKNKVMASIYQINKGVSKPIIFRGLKAQYIAYLAVGLVLLLIAFVILYVSDVPLLIILPVIIGLGGMLFWTTYKLSHRFGEHGLMKYFAKRNLPVYLKFRSRRLFTTLKNR